jgi:fructokinase
MYDITVLGEALIDFTEDGVSENGMRLFEQNPGGAVANVACAASKLGRKCAFIGKVGADMHGEFLKKTLENMGVDTSAMIMSQDYFTTLAFITLSRGGECVFSFARKPGADTQLTPQEVDTAIIDNTRILHVGSLSLTHEPARTATLYAIKRAKSNGAIISYDPNYRAMLWNNELEAAVHMRALISLCDVIKLAGDEAQIMTGTSNIEQAIRFLHNAGAKCSIITLSRRGSIITIDGKSKQIPAFYVPHVVDTTGAGDAFLGAFLSRFILSGADLGAMDIDTAGECARYASAAAAVSVARRGAIPSLANERDIEAVLLHDRL